MDVIFWLTRLPFFLIGVAIWTAIGIVALDILVMVAILTMLLAVPFWVLVLLPGAVIFAAFTNNKQAFSSFLQWTREVIGDATAWLREQTTEFLKAYRDLWNWQDRGWRADVSTKSG